LSGLHGAVRAALILVAVGVLLVGLLWVFQRSLIYLPSTRPLPSAAALLDGGRDVQLVTADGLRLAAWYLPAKARAPGRGAAVLVANGNAGDRAARAPLARALAERGLAVLLFDYRGYGGNPGRPSENGLARDVRAAQRFLVEQAGMPPERQIYYGESLGAAVVAELAVEHPPGGMVLRSPFVDLASVGRVHYPFLPVRSLLKDRYPVVSHVGRVHVPITVVYGTRDSIVPPEQSLAVARAVRGGARVVAVENAGHNDGALLDGAELIDAVVDLAGRLG
jgi:uncharacterized protein